MGLEAGKVILFQTEALLGVKDKDPEVAKMTLGFYKVTEKD